MTLQEILKSQGLSDEQIETITGEMKQNKIFTANEENLDVRYSKLKTEHDNLVAQHGESTKLIDQFKADAKNNEALQGRVANYEATIAQLNEQLKQTQLDAEIKIALLGAKAVDVDYMTFKLKEKGEIELGEDGKIKGLDDKLAGLKTQFPTQFESAQAAQKLQPQRLPAQNNIGGTTTTKEEFNKMGYESRVKLKEADPELYAQLMKG